MSAPGHQNPPPAAASKEAVDPNSTIIAVSCLREDIAVEKRQELIDLIKAASYTIKDVSGITKVCGKFRFSFILPPGMGNPIAGSADENTTMRTITIDELKASHEVYVKINGRIEELEAACDAYEKFKQRGG
ncbi:hypothetical protein N0V83_008010 [Neocucurbitaria cava]|uniref:Uncharacterized protein n=1 Tax=Neocucurbitaria cava TaxID=798079 RepID=A0A9W9CJ58_9PLEO|nr:hypothetical protein N0V83_008010 [Neocucurbitaria cava]